MSRVDGVLVCVVRQAPFDLFDAGIKGAEYRNDSPFWCRQILTPQGWGVLRTGRPEEELFSDGYPELFQPLHTLRVPLGFQPGRAVLEMPITLIDWGMPNPEWTCGIITPKPCFRIAVDVTKRRRIA